MAKNNGQNKGQSRQQKEAAKQAELQKKARQEELRLREQERAAEEKRLKGARQHETERQRKEREHTKKMEHQAWVGSVHAAISMCIDVRELLDEKPQQVVEMSKPITYKDTLLHIKEQLEQKEFRALVEKLMSIKRPAQGVITKRFGNLWFKATRDSLFVGEEHRMLPLMEGNRVDPDIIRANRTLAEIFIRNF